MRSHNSWLPLVVKLDISQSRKWRLSRRTTDYVVCQSWSTTELSWNENGSEWMNFFWNSFLLTCVTSWEPFDPIAGHAFNIVRLSPTDRGREPWTRNRKECFPIEPRTNAWYPLSIINIWDTMGPIFFNLPPKGPAVIFQDGFWLNMSIPLQIKNTSLQKWHNLKNKL